MELEDILVDHAENIFHMGVGSEHFKVGEKRNLFSYILVGVENTVQGFAMRASDLFLL